MRSMQSASKNRSCFPSCVICIHKNVLVSAGDDTAFSLSEPFDASVTFKIGVETLQSEGGKGKYRTRAREAAFGVGEAAEHWTKTCTVSRQFRYRSYM